MTATIRDIITINDNAVERLAAIGIRTLAQLLEAGASSSGRMRLADQANLDDATIKSWVHQADLMRVKGIGPEVAHILHEAGVVTVPKLAYRNATSLHAELTEAHKHADTRIPSVVELHGMIKAAKGLPKLVHH